jgi:ADP-heptose:LPS heptosyltransferase
MAPTKRVLIYRLGSLGDTVVALPGFHLIARAFPNAERRLLTNFPVAAKAPPAAAILEGTGTVSGYFRYSAGTRNVLELARLWSQIVRWSPEVLVYLGPARGIDSTRRDASFFRLCGIKRLVGVPLTEDMQQNRSALDPVLGYETLEYEAQRLARNLAELGDARIDDPASWDLHLTPAEHAKAAKVLAPALGSSPARPLIALCIGTKVQANEWSPESWRALLGRLAELYPTHALALTGAPIDRDPSDLIASAWQQCAAARQQQNPAGLAGPVLNLCGQLTPRESAAVFARSAVYIGHDSGPMHLAAAVRTPCVAIFSARGKPRRWFPFGPGHRVLYHRVDCWGCALDTCTVQAKKCILSITVDEVLTEVRAILG